MSRTSLPIHFMLSHVQLFESFPLPIQKGGRPIENGPCSSWTCDLHSISIILRTHWGNRHSVGYGIDIHKHKSLYKSWWRFEHLTKPWRATSPVQVLLAQPASCWKEDAVPIVYLRRIFALMSRRNSPTSTRYLEQAMWARSWLKCRRSNVKTQWIHWHLRPRQGLGTLFMAALVP